MTSKVRLKKGSLVYFSKLARKSPNEIQAFLIGTVVNQGLIEIDEFVYPKEYAISTPSQVCWFQKDYEVIQKRAEERGKRVVGFIHSHPEGDVVMSPADYNVCITDMHRLCGVCSIENKKAYVRFWVMDCALPCEIEYAKTKRE